MWWLIPAAFSALASIGEAAVPAAITAGTTGASAAGTAAAAGAGITTGLTSGALEGALLGTEAAAPAAAGGMKLSQALAGLKGASQALRLGSFLIPNKQAKNTLNLMSMTTGAAADAKDPMALMKSMEGPMKDIASNFETGAGASGKRLSEVAPQAAPGGFPQPTATQFIQNSRDRRLQALRRY